jgi:hypothetical protein
MDARMSWKRRILELTLAGGIVAGAGSGCSDSTPKIPLCNANPDPCCSMPDSAACKNRDLSVPVDMATPRDLTPPSD